MGTGASASPGFSITPDYKVHVKTGDRKGAGTDANVYIALINDHGQRSRDIKLDCRFKDDFERGNVDTFLVSNLPNFGKIATIELWRDDAGPNDDWYVDTVAVDNVSVNERYMFPVHRWVRDVMKLFINEYDVCLPQDDYRPEQRQYELLKKRRFYQFECKAEGLIPQIKDFPVDESFSDDYKWDIVKLKAKLMLQTKTIQMTTRSWKKLDDIGELYTGFLPKPYGMENWRSDKEFGYQRLTGCNATHIRLCTQIPDKFPVTDAMLRPLLEGMTISEALSRKRLFILDYEILHDLPCTNGRKICAPMCLFFVNKHRNLMPLAIQLHQNPSENNPIFLPTDPEYVWLMAKMWFNNADASFHQSTTHLAYTHLIIESVAVATHRCLSQSHPMFRLLAPHFIFLIAINTRALAKLVSEGGWVDKCMAIGRVGMFEIIRRSWSRWSLQKQGSLEKDLADRGVDDPEVLPNYHYRDDARLVRRATHDYVKTIVDHHYTSEERVTSDFELQHWGKTLCSCCKMKGVPNGGAFSTADEVTEIMTNFIFISSVGHAASNFSQYDEYGFPPNYPSFLFGDPPRDKTELTEKDILAQMPPKDMALSIMLVTKLLSDRGTNGLGDFEVQYLHDTVSLQALKQFKADLLRVGAIIDERNETREEKYTYLNPKEIPNAISI
ncbi:allene oxide synthase-lipoxygenase protein-like [Lytechinus pictus]|uniref:allene oxide synthase-lipoxygenase protein-like n=1 Tax=Lytechinus pictus TaxID=7653 RepID=UPI0030BA1202